MKQLIVIGLTEAVDQEQLNEVACGEKVCPEDSKHEVVHIKRFDLLTDDAIKQLVQTARVCKTETGNGIQSCKVNI